MLNQPTSSPMMTSMLGGRCCCAATGVLATVATATNASRAGQSFRMSFMENLLTFRVRGKDAKETTPPTVALLQRPAVFTGGAGKQRRRPCLCYANAYSQRIACAAARAANGPSASVMPAPIWLISAVARGLSSQPCNKLTANAAFNGDIHKAPPNQIARFSWHRRAPPKNNQQVDTL